MFDGLAKSCDTEHAGVSWYNFDWWSNGNRFRTSHYYMPSVCVCVMCACFLVVLVVSWHVLRSWLLPCRFYTTSCLLFSWSRIKPWIKPATIDMLAIMLYEIISCFFAIVHINVFGHSLVSIISYFVWIISLETYSNLFIIALVFDLRPSCNYYLASTFFKL